MGLSYMTNAELRNIAHILITHNYDGQHVIRRNDRFWADLSTDLFIEVVIINFRTTDGLTRRSGMNEIKIFKVKSKTSHY